MLSEEILNFNGRKNNNNSQNTELIRKLNIKLMFSLN